jgi:Rieske Fe-S protein
LQGIVGTAGVAVAGPAFADTPETMPPQVGDFLVTALGKDALDPERVRLNANGPFEAWPMSPDGVPRRGSPENQLQLFRYAPEDLSPEVAAMAAGGVVALTAICTHAGCPATEFVNASRSLVCPCHGSGFDPKAGGKLLNGPAVRKLPQLKIALKDGKMVVAGGYDGRVGGDTTPGDDH